MAVRKRERDLLQLVYASKVAPGVTDDDLETIAAISQSRNEAAGLTGLLLRQGEAFYGVLEGRSRLVLARMEAIASDRRHSGVRILREEAIEQRRFASWSYGVLPAPSGLSESDPGEDFINRLARGLK